MRTLRGLLPGVPALAMVVLVGAALDASATSTTASDVGSGLGFTAPIGSDKGSVVGPPGHSTSASNLLGEEPIYYPRV